MLFFFHFIEFLNGKSGGSISQIGLLLLDIEPQLPNQALPLSQGHPPHI
jgi:hypothetical protein